MNEKQYYYYKQACGCKRQRTREIDLISFIFKTKYVRRDTGLLLPIDPGQEVSENKSFLSGWFIIVVRDVT